jgi:type IV pilus assembly protein PilA
MPSGYSAAGSATTIVAAATQGKYVGSINVIAGGEITILYTGSQANSKLSGSTLTLNPGTDTNLDVVWVCGTATLPTGVTAGTGTTTTTVLAQYLPASCHP